MTRVTLVADGTPPGECTRLVLQHPPADVDEALALARRLGEIADPPGGGSTRDLWEALATLAAVDLGAARVVEPHLDALAILSQAGESVRVRDADTWGVFAAEGGSDPVQAESEDGQWRLTGLKPWCSLAGRLERALVTARLPEGGRGLFDVDLRQSGVIVLPDAWHSRGLAEIPSGPIELRGAAAVPVGAADWYLTRPGFAWGAIGVAACWFGGAVAIARTVFTAVGDGPPPLQAMQLGRIDDLVQGARRALAEAVGVLDGEHESDGAILAKRVRSAVARSCEGILSVAGHALGPAPLALDGRHSKRVADLQLYIRQHHAERDDASLGTSLAKIGVAPW